MKIYETHTAPNPRRVRIFLAEKNITVEYVQLDLQKGENMSPLMRAKNPIGKVPVLELDDGTCISETVAICRYFEEVQAQPPLFGSNPVEKAQIEMWQRQVEFGLMMQIGMCFQHTTGYFKDRMTPIKEYGEEAGKIAQSYLKQLERRLADSEFVGGDNFSIADITTLCAIDFGRVVKIRIGEEQSNLQRWYQQINARPSASA
jgi:glutathione S-transferase